MKKILFGSVSVVIIAAVLATPYYLGIKAQQSLEEQHRTLAKTFFFDVQSHQYERGWFFSTEITTLRFHPTVLNNLGQQLPDNIRTILERPITMVNHVKHYPFANGIMPVRAVVSTEFKYDAETQKILQRFFNDKTPLTLQNVIALDGSGKMTVQVSPFDYEELSGIKLKWQGLTGDVQYQDQFNAFNSHFSAPLLTAQLADKGNMAIQNVNIETETLSNKNNPIALGSSKTSVGRFEVAWQEGLSYNVKLNDLINMITDLQIGAFINPNGTIAPNKISVENLSYNTQTTEPEAGFINSQGVFAFDKLHYGETLYGPLAIDAAVEHLDAKSLNALKTRWQQITSTPQSTTGNTEQQQDQYLAAVRQEGAGIFTQNPLFKLNKFEFTTPTGHVKAAGSLKFNGLQTSDLNSLSPMIAKMNAQLDLDVSQSLIEDFAITQTRGLFTVENPNNPQEQQEIDDTIKLLTTQTLDNMSQEGYLQKDNGAIKTRLVIENNQIILNNKTLQTQSDEDLFANLDDENAVPAQPENASEPK